MSMFHLKFFWLLLFQFNHHCWSLNGAESGVAVAMISSSLVQIALKPFNQFHSFSVGAEIRIEKQEGWRKTCSAKYQDLLEIDK
jgi:hypothetical protein